MTKPLPRAEIAYRALRQAIIEQQLKPGTKLPEEEIGAAFGISRTLSRQALARLNGDGLVETGNKRTATVARPGLEEAREIFEMRRGLEAQAVRLVVKRWRAEYGSALEGHVREERAAEGRDPAVAIRLAGEFHIKLAEMAGNRLLLRYLTEVVSRCSLILAVYGRPHSSECAISEHQEVIAALRAGDAERAVAIMDEHIGSVEARALLADSTAQEPLAAVLSRYATGGDAGNVGALGARPARTRRMSE
jgi:DNA-binding GntR family transcriptional regulator